MLAVNINPQVSPPSPPSVIPLILCVNNLTLIVEGFITVCAAHITSSAGKMFYRLLFYFTTYLYKEKLLVMLN